MFKGNFACDDYILGSISVVLCGMRNIGNRLHDFNYYLSEIFLFVSTGMCLLEANFFLNYKPLTLP